MKVHQGKLTGCLFLTVLIFIGCSPGRFLVNRLAGSLGSAGSIYLTENDPQLVREAFPFNLKTIEMLLQQSPENPDLLTAAASGFTMYSYAFILEDADRLAATDISASRPVYQRAQHLLERGRDYGLQALEARHPGFRDQFQANPESVVKALDSEDILAAYWTAAAIGGAIAASKGHPALLIDLPKVGYLLERALELDANWNGGALYGALMKYELSRPDQKANADEVAQEYYRRARELSGGNDCSLYVAYAEAFSIRNQDRAEFEEMLTAALKINVDEVPALRLSNLLAQDRARWLLERIDDLFYY
ncbi:MAG: TRAP transporter TatT component family protein [Candidatus Neomarinimicrobiota bacterium]